MKSRYRVTALAFVSLSAGTFCLQSARADAPPPFKIDPRLLGQPGLEEPPKAPPPAAKPAVPEPSIATPLPPPTATKPQPLPQPVPPAVTAAPSAPPRQTPVASAANSAPAPNPTPIARPAAPTAARPAPSAARPSPPARADAPEPFKVDARLLGLPGLEEPAKTPPSLARPAEPSVPPPLPPAALDGQALRLAPTLDLVAHPTPPGEKRPVFISAMRIEGQADTYVQADEDAELRKPGLVVNADTLHYDEQKETVDAQGKVRLQTDSGVLKGPDLHYDLTNDTGNMNTPVYALANAQGQGSGKKLNVLGKDRVTMDDGQYSTCAVGKEAWWIKADKLEVNRTENEGVGRNAIVEFKGVPLLYTPYISFPLVPERESGFLSPAFATSNTRGFELAVPYYFNLAPNYDATLTPRILTKRGIEIGGEFRYLQPNYSGQINGEVLPNDRVSNTTRDALRVKHQQNFGYGLTGNIDFERVSDNNYFRDLSPLIAATSRTTLLREGNLNWGYGPYSAGLKVQRFQILQDPVTPVPVPYERLPQLTAGYRKLNIAGLADVVASAEYVQFGHSTNVTGSRFTLYPSVSLPLTQAYGYLTPKLGVHYTRYKLDPIQNPTNLPDTTRTLPILSVDGGLTFERETSLLGRAVTQTLEPRVYYLYVPYRDQNPIPLFDTGDADFTFAQVFSENRYSGGDRISDANQVTLALTSRFLESSTGLERLRASVAQRIFFETPRVTLTPTTPAITDHVSDFLASIGGQITPAWSADAGLQYNPNLSRNEKYNVGVRYSPEVGKLANFNYRFTRGSLHQVDTSGQWQVSPRWQLLGRVNYSIQDGKVVEALGGVEYREGCWALRFVLHRFQTATLQTTNALFLQLELAGLSSLGTNPFNILKQNIGGYSQTRPHPEEINLNEF